MENKHSKVIIVITVLAVLVCTGFCVYLLTGRSRSTINDDSVIKIKKTAPTKIARKNPKERIAYLSGSDIYVMEMDGTEHKKITGRGDIIDFQVSPDGKRIAFMAAVETQLKLFTISSDGTEESQVVHQDQILLEPFDFDPTGEYIYYLVRINTRIRPTDIPEETVVDDLVRYSVKTGRADHVYSLSHGRKQRVQGLWADPKGGTLYYNLQNSDYLSAEPYKINLGPPVTDSVYLPREGGNDDATTYYMTGISVAGTHVSYFKWNPKGPDQDICYKAATGENERVVVAEKDFQFKPLEYSGLEFSSVCDSTFYYTDSRRMDGGETLRFYRGYTDKGLPEMTGLELIVSHPPFKPMWHVIATSQSEL